MTGLADLVVDWAAAAFAPVRGQVTVVDRYAVAPMRTIAIESKIARKMRGRRSCPGSVDSPEAPFVSCELTN